MFFGTLKSSNTHLSRFFKNLFELLLELPTVKFEYRPLCVLLIWISLAFTASSSAETIAWPQTESLNPAEFSTYLQDPTNHLTASDINEIEAEFSFQNRPIISAIRDSIWLSFDVEEMDGEIQQLIISSSNYTYDHIEVYKRSYMGAISLIGEFGDVDRTQSPTGQPEKVAVALKPHSINRFYVRLQHGGSYVQPIRLSSPDRYAQNNQLNTLHIGFFYGSIITLLVAYSLAISSNFKKEHLYFLLATTFSITMIMQSDGLIVRTLPTITWFASTTMEVFIYINIVFWGLFAQNHISKQQLKSSSPPNGDKLLTALRSKIISVLVYIGAIFFCLELLLYWLNLETPINRLIPLSVFSLFTGSIIVMSVTGYCRSPLAVLITAAYLFCISLHLVYYDIFNQVKPYNNSILIRVGFEIQIYIAIFELIRGLIFDKKQTLKNDNDAEHINVKKMEIKQLISSISSSLRTPLTGVTGMIDLIRTTTLNPTQKQCIDIIENSSGSILTVIDDMEDYNEIDYDHGQINIEKFNLEDCITSVCHFYASSALTKNIELICYERIEPPKVLIGDQTKIRKILSRILTNAINNSNNNDITIESKILSSNNPDRIKISIIVSNKIISSNLKNTKLLRDFFESNTDNTDIKGLHICKKLVELLGGELHHDSNDEMSHVGFSLDLEVGPHQTEFGCNALTDHHCLLISPNNTRGKMLDKQLDQWKMKITHLQKISFIDKDYLNNHDFHCCIIDMDDVNTCSYLSQRFIQEHHNLLPPTVFMSYTLRQPDFNSSLHQWPTRSIAKPLHPSKLKNMLKTLVLLKNEKPDEYISLSKKAATATRMTIPLAIEEEAASFDVNVLVAEDNRVNRQVVLSLLSRLGAKSDFVINGCEATTRLCEKERSFDLVIMDCDMPEMDGFEATQKIRQYERRTGLAPIPIIALTSHGSSHNKNKAQQAGMNSFITKPITLDALRREIKKISGDTNTPNVVKIS